MHPYKRTNDVHSIAFGTSLLTTQRLLPTIETFLQGFFYLRLCGFFFLFFRDWLKAELCVTMTKQTYFVTLSKLLPELKSPSYVATTEDKAHSGALHGPACLFIIRYSHRVQGKSSTK